MARLSGDSRPYPGDTSQRVRALGIPDTTHNLGEANNKGMIPMCFPRKPALGHYNATRSEWLAAYRKARIVEDRKSVV